MEDTGRIQRGLLPQIRRTLFERPWDDEVEAELQLITDVDRAHALMLSEQGIVAPEKVQQLLRAIEDLRVSRFAPLRGRSASRGLYLLYEDYLIATQGSGAGGILQTARSRNDLNATTVRLRLRAVITRLVREGLRLQSVVLRRARRYSNLVMPAYTHGQAALPTTLGHYLAGIAVALARDLQGIVRACDGLQRCPLGAGAVAGTTLPINTQRTAALLGFTRPEHHSTDAVASRDIVLRVLSAATVLGITLSRLATDLWQWCTAEFGFLALPDEVVGSSSAMPQKRNPFLLEHVQGKAGAALGAFVAAATAMHSTPFANSIAVGTEAVKHAWRALDEMAEASLLTRLVVGRIQPQSRAMLQRTEQGFTTATALASYLVTEGGQDFRSAHHDVGRLVSAATMAPHRYAEYFQDLCDSHQLSFKPELLDPSHVAHEAEYGGGPGPESLRRLLSQLRSEWSRLSAHCRRRQRIWKQAENTLQLAVTDALLQPASQTL